MESRWREPRSKAGDGDYAHTGSSIPHQQRPSLGGREFSTETISLTLACSALLAALLAVEGGAAFRTTPFERLVGITYLFSVSVVSANILSWEGAELWARVTRDLIIIAAPVVVNFRLKTLLDLSQEARNFGSMTLSYFS